MGKPVGCWVFHRRVLDSWEEELNCNRLTGSGGSVEEARAGLTDGRVIGYDAAG